MTFKDVAVKGRVGLLIKGDSFMPENYDVEYECEGSEVSVIWHFREKSSRKFKFAFQIGYFIDSETKVESKITSPAGGKILFLCPNDSVMFVYRQKDHENRRKPT